MIHKEEKTSDLRYGLVEDRRKRVQQEGMHVGGRDGDDAMEHRTEGHAVRKVLTVPASVYGVQKTRVAAYCRVSTDSTEQESSIESQRKHFEMLIRSHGEWEFKGIYWEAGVSGTKREYRPELRRLLNDCREGRVDLVLTKSISRFARNTADCLDMVRKLLALGVGVLFEKERIDTRTIDSELLMTLFSSVAEEESRSISTNAKWAVKKRFASGTYRFSKAPFGYRLENGSYSVDSDRAAVVRRIFGEVLSGKGTLTIAKELNEEGIGTGTKKRNGTEGQWSSAIILGMIRNLSYTGDILMQKTYTDTSFRRMKNQGERDQYYMDGHHEAIVSHEIFENANRVIAERAAKMDGEDTHRRYPLSDRLTCACCGGPMKRITARRNGDVRYYWGCSAHTKDAGICPMRREKEESLFNAFMNMLRKLKYASREVMGTYIDLLTVEEYDPESRRRAGEILIRRREITKEKGRFLVLVSTERSGSFTARKKIMELTEEDAGLERELKSLTSSTPKMEQARELVRILDEWEPGGVFDGDLFMRITDQVTVRTGDSVLFRLRCGLELKEDLR